MSQSTGSKLIARNVAAFRKFSDPKDQPRLAAGNPSSSLLESGVGNCFPGLECDLRNLERRFFPFLEIDIASTLDSDEVQVVSVDTDGVQAAVTAGTVTQDDGETYGRIANALRLPLKVIVTNIDGNFGVLGSLAFDPRMLNGTSRGSGRLPTDTWTAIRLLVEDTPVILEFEIRGVELKGGAKQLTLTGNRCRYLDDNGALAAMFLPGELTQSLCSPWTHDFRDCGCFYWASNHPDIVQPVRPLGLPPGDEQQWSGDVAWQRRDRTIGPTPPPLADDVTSPSKIELRHYEINHRWEELHFVINRRETIEPVSPLVVKGNALPDKATLIQHLQYAAGVEIAVAQEYLAAAYSLKADEDPSIAGNKNLTDAIKATRAEILRISIGEMRHTRAVNDVLRALMPAGSFQPALRVASKLPSIGGASFRPVQPRVASKAAIADFIEIEQPSAGVDGLYIDILETLKNPPSDIAEGIADEWVEAIGSVIAEGEDHYQTFLDIQEWLSSFAESDYLRNPAAKRPPIGEANHDALQSLYRKTLDGLFQGYLAGRLPGASNINGARANMIEPGGLNELSNKVAEKGFLVAFDPINDPAFSPIDPP